MEIALPPLELLSPNPSFLYSWFLPDLLKLSNGDQLSILATLAN